MIEPTDKEIEATARALFKYHLSADDANWVVARADGKVYDYIVAAKIALQAAAKVRGDGTK